MSQKRDLPVEEPAVLDDKKRPRFDDSEHIFRGISMQLHPAALGRKKRAIFEKQIVCNGGTLVDSLEETVSGKFLVVVESGSMDAKKLRAIVEKCIESFSNTKSEIVSTGWLSKCLEEKRRIETKSFRLDKKLLAKRVKADCTSEPNDPGSQPSTSCSRPGETSAHIDRVKDKFVCAQSSENPQSANLNKNITDELEKLAAAYKSSNDRWRAFGYQKAIAAIKNHPRQIRSRIEATKIPNVGAKMAEKGSRIYQNISGNKILSRWNSFHYSE